MLIILLDKRKILTYTIAALVIVLVFGWANYLSLDLMQVVSQNTKQIPIYSVETPDKKVALTFDCAWGAEDMPGILETLRKENIKATFFIVGSWVDKYPEVVKAIAREGHDIANHSDTHQYMSQISYEKMREEISSTATKMEKLLGKRTELFRAPYGDYNSKVLMAAAEEKHYTIQWDVDSLDWKDISLGDIRERVRSRVKSGSIVLLHNGTKYTASALQLLIKDLKESGYSFVPVSQLIMRENYYVDATGRQYEVKN